MWPFKKKQESRQEIAAEKKLGEVTREVAWEEADRLPDPKDEHGPARRFSSGR